MLTKGNIQSRHSRVILLSYLSPTSILDIFRGALSFGGSTFIPNQATSVDWCLFVFQRTFIDSWPPLPAQFTLAWMVHLSQTKHFPWLRLSLLLRFVEWIWALCSAVHGSSSPWKKAPRIQTVWSMPRVCGWFIYLSLSSGNPWWMPSGQGTLFLCWRFSGYSKTSPLETSVCVKATISFPVQKALEIGSSPFLLMIKVMQKEKQT